MALIFIHIPDPRLNSQATALLTLMPSGHDWN